VTPASSLRVQDHGPILVLTIARPERRNALDNHTLRLLREALSGAAADETRKVLVLEGEGGVSFCAGSDLKALAEMSPSERLAHTALGQAVMEEIEDHPCLAIAAVEGFCLGGGFELALACDLRISGSGATFGFPEVALSGIPGWGGTYRLTRVAGLGLTKAVTLAGIRLDAERALAAGVLTEVVEQGRAVDRAVEFGLELADTVGRPALSRAKVLVNASASIDNRLGRHLELLTESELSHDEGFLARGSRG